MLEILARVLMLMACVPLLQPAGFCICKLDCSSPTLPAQQCAEVQVRSLPSAQKSECCTLHCGTNGGNKSTAPEPQRPYPSPTDDNHMPGCPASVGADQLKWAVPAETFAQTLPPAEIGALLPFELATPVNVRPTLSGTHSTSSPPFYLSHCSLVI